MSLLPPARRVGRRTRYACLRLLSSAPAVFALAVLFAGASCPPRPPDPNPTPTPDPTPTPTPPTEMPAKDVAVFPELLVRQGEGGSLTRGGTPWKPSGAVQCCMATDTSVSVYEKAFGVKQHQRPRRPRPFRIGRTAAEVNSRWPSISPEVMKFFHDEGGADMFEVRIAPYLGDADHESEWADVGGPVLPGQWPNFNEPWFEMNREHGFYAGSVLGSNRRYIWDAWYGKTQKNGSQPHAWTNAAAQAWGEVFTADHQRFIDKIVMTFGCQMNAEWGVDNEGALVPRAKREYFEAVAWGFRSAEDRFPCKQPDGSLVVVRHVISTNWPEQGDGPYDFVATHDDGPLTKLYFGKHSYNNERNGTTYTAEQDLAMHCGAWKINGAFYFWRAEDSDSLMRQKLALRKAGCAGNVPVGCFLPGANDPNWNPEPIGGGSKILNAGVDSMKLAVGERCGAADKYAALDIAAEEARARGYCAAGRWGDAFAVACPDNDPQAPCVLEYHLVSFQDGCWAANPAVLPKNTWKYNRPLPRSVWCDGVAPMDEILCRPHVPAGTYDCTTKRDGQPIAPEGTPGRREKELCAQGNADPTYRLQVTSGSISLQAMPNPMQFKVIGSGTGRVTCTAGVPGTFCNVDVQR